MSTTMPSSNKSLLRNAEIHIENYYDIETWFLVLICVLVLLISVLCGAWCLCAARNVRRDTTVTHVDFEDVKKSRKDRSDAGLDTVIEVDGTEKKVRVVAGVMVRMGQSLGLLN